MYSTLLISALVILFSIIASRALVRFGVPTLIIFLILGMLFGSDGIVGIYFNDFVIAEHLSSVALAFIIFYGGFGTKIQIAKQVVPHAILMASFGTIITAAITGFFCQYILNVNFLYGMLLGTVLSSTDAASVFSILRSQKLNLKHGLASLIEIESGSNDPFAYTMTIILIAMIKVKDSPNFVYLFASQIFLGLLVGVVVACTIVFILRKVQLNEDAFYSLLLIAVVLFGYAICGIVNGNGFLCVYVIGIIIGNCRILHKVSLVHFFDAFSWLMQILLFFILGLLSFPSKLPQAIVPALLISVVMILIARPIATFGVLSWFKVPIKAQIFVSWVGMRGAASSVFSIIAVSSGIAMPYDIFHIVFIVAIVSVLLQGSLTSWCAKKLDLVDDSDKNLIFKTFNDYHEEIQNRLMEYTISKGHKWANKMIIDANIPEELLIVMIKRNNTIVVPKGSTEILERDVLVISSEDFSSLEKKHLKASKT